MSQSLLATGLFVAVLLAVVARQLIGRGPPTWSLFLAGGGVAVASGALPGPQTLSVLSGAVPVLAFLLALFVLASALERAGALEHLARWLVGRAPSRERIPAVLFIGFALASACIVNDALVVIGVPVLVALARRLRLEPRPLLLTLAASVTVGSALTPFGNPQNLLVSIDSGIAAPVAVFLRYLLVPTAANIAFGAWYVGRRSRREPEPPSVPSTEPVVAVALLPVGGWGRRLARAPILAIFPITMALLVGLDLAQAVVAIPTVPSWVVAGAGALATLALSPHRLGVLRGVSWSVLLLFVGLFVVVGAAVHGGVVAGAERLLPLPGPSDRLAGIGTIATGAVVGSQLVSNVPWVAVQVPLLLGAGYSASTPLGWMALAACSTLAGNFTLLGAASNVIVVDLAEKAGLRIDLRAFVRFALPLGTVTVLVVLACLAVGV